MKLEKKFMRNSEHVICLFRAVIFPYCFRLRFEARLYQAFYHVKKIREKARAPAQVIP